MFPLKMALSLTMRVFVRLLPTLRTALSQGAIVMVMSHLGRPTEGKPDDNFSLKPVAEALSKALGQKVRLVKDWIDGGKSYVWRNCFM